MPSKVSVTISTYNRKKNIDKNDKKIVFIFDNWFSDKGGRKKVTLSLLNNIKNFDLTIFAIETKTSFSQISNFKDDLLNNINITPLFTKHNIFLPLKIFFKLGYFLKTEKPDLVVAVGGGTHSNALFILVSKFFIPKTPTTIINHGNPDYFLKKQNFILRYLTKIFYRKTNAVIAVSNELKEHLNEVFFKGEDRCFTIYNGLDLNDIQKKSHEFVNHKWFIEKDKPIILSVARLDEQSKDFATLIRAFRLLLKKTEARLVIVGDGLDKKELEFLVKTLNLEEKVWFAGFQANPYKFMAKSDIFVLSSKHEALPTVLLEAMACGLIIVSSDCNYGPREILNNGKYGFLVPVGDYKKMADVMEKIIMNDKIKKQLVALGKNRVKDFTIEKNIKAYEEFFNKILNKNEFK